MNKEKAETLLENYQALSELYSNMRKELEDTRRALDVATGFIKGISQTAINDCDNQYVVLGNFKKFAQDTLNQIKTALEQKDYFMKKILCFFGFHKWWFSGTLDGRLVMPRNGQIRVCQRCGKRQQYFTALFFGASDLGWQNVD